MTAVSASGAVAVPMPAGFSLARTCAPAAWAGGRWPNEDWIDGAFWWAGHDRGVACWRRVSAIGGGVLVEGTGDADGFADWAMRVLAPRPALDRAADPVIAALDRAFPGLGQLNSGDMADGATFAIVGQSVSLASAGVTASRLSAMFHPGFALAGRTLWPLPAPADLAAARPDRIRPCGVTGKRAEALVAAAALFAAAEIPGDPATFGETPAARLLSTPGVGPWTVASTLLWGGGHPDVFPPGDAALLRAARAACADPGLDHRGLEARSARWAGHRSVAARLLWTALFGHPGDAMTPGRGPAGPGGFA
ncbi:MAG: hypothetical protein ACKOWF_10375 [Chloroflexota bacterium]